MKSTPISKASVRKATGKTWEEWFDYLNQANAQEISHKEIAKMLSENDEVSGWWAQSITVEYERRIGRREVRQSGTGDFQASFSKTLPGNMDEVFHKWKDFVKGMEQLNSIPFEGPPQSSETEKWRYWRVTLQNGSRVSVMVSQKDRDKVQLSASHEKLPDAKAVETWKRFWRNYFQEFQKYYPHPAEE